MSETIIEANKLGLKSGHRYLLQDIDWTVKQGEHWLVFGMNGSGKTTLLSIIAGFKASTHGSLKMFGTPYDSSNILAIRQKIGFVSSSFFDKQYTQESALDIVLSGLLGTLGIDDTLSDEDVLRAKALLEEVRMGDKINLPFDMMSKGERQNVLIARALIANPEVLILDEPGTGPDVFAREHMLCTVRDLANSTKMTIIYVTHYTEEIQPMFDHCMLLKHGRAYANGRTSDIFTSEFLSQFLEYPVQVKRADDGYLRVSLEVFSNIKTLIKNGVTRWR